MRQLKYHEQKLLKKVDFLQWKREHNQRELQVRDEYELWRKSGKRRRRRRQRRPVHSRSLPPRPLPALTSPSTTAPPPATKNLSQVMRRYHIQGRDDYAAYNRLCGLVTKLAATLKRLPPDDPDRIELTEAVLGRCYDLGVTPTKRSLADVASLSTAAFARRRLAVVMVRLRMADTPRAAATFVEAGHVRVGPDPVTDPAFHVSRAAEDWVTWTDTSAIKRRVAAYNDAVDDFDLLAA